MFSCKENKAVYPVVNQSTEDSVFYAKWFRIKTFPNYILLKIQNPYRKSLVLQTYILVSKSKKLLKHFPKGQVICVPLKKVICFSSVLCEILNELNVLHTVIGVTEPQYIPSQFIQKSIQNGSIKNVGLSANPNVEKLTFLNPNAIFLHFDPITINCLLEKTKIPIICCPDYMETTPLGQSEWIRLIGLFFNKRKLADSLFFNTVKRYNKVKKLVKTDQNRPTVFTEMKYGDIWYMPGGKSYLAQMLNDAGANYVLRKNKNTGSVALSFETVLCKAKNANYWLIKYYSSQSITYRQLVNNYHNYSLFDAYKNRNIYVCNTFKNPDYYQNVFLYPDKLLKEMIILFHPELFLTDTALSLFYYKKL